MGSVGLTRSIDWLWNPMAEESRSYLPKMITDITLEHPDRKIILDTKFYAQFQKASTTAKPSSLPTSINSMPTCLNSPVMRKGDKATATAVHTHTTTEPKAFSLRHCGGEQLRPSICHAATSDDRGDCRPQHALARCRAAAYGFDSKSTFGFDWDLSRKRSKRDNPRS